MIRLLRNLKFKSRTYNAGMTYVEVAVVLSIFAVVGGVVMFSYNDFQNRVDIRNLASDIALKIVEAQKSAAAGLLPPNGAPASWKPSYGVHFDRANATEFVYFVDLYNLTYYDGCTDECLNTIAITKGNKIADLKVYSGGTSSSVMDLTVTYARPASRARITSGGGEVSNVDHVEIIVSSADEETQSIIKLYESGRIDIE